ncbi:MAG: sugar ABC transporter substrate-binding protein [Planctomycetes bacterium]|nr:sugar ABC transporter substrate-binding protein [Planctomycetota bacterium]MCD7897510.1 sugar ABC transporter substrate-binding protein [Planctomycetaceae bacterium]
MKRLCLMCSVAVLFCLCAVQAGEKRYKFALVCKAMDSEFWTDMRNGATEAAARLGNVDVVVLAPDREVNVQQQVAIVDDLIVQNVDGIAIAPCGANELIPVMEEARNAGIPVILVDTDAAWENKLAFAGTNNRKGGRQAGERIVNLLGGKGTVAIITGIMGHQTHIDRVAGAMEVFSQYPGIRIVAQQPANGERSLGMTVMENILTGNPDLDALFSTNATMGLGAYEAAKAVDAKCIIVGFDSDSEMLGLIKAGEIDSLVAQGAYDMGHIGIESLYKHLQGESIPKLIDVPSELVTRENVDKHLKK